MKSWLSQGSSVCRGTLPSCKQALSGVTCSAHRAGYRLQSEIKADETFAVRCEACAKQMNVLDTIALIFSKLSGSRAAERCKEPHGFKFCRRLGKRSAAKPANGHTKNSFFPGSIYDQNSRKIKFVKNKQHVRKVLLSSFHLNGHTLGFYPQTQNLESCRKA